MYVCVGVYVLTYNMYCTFFHVTCKPRLESFIIVYCNVVNNNNNNSYSTEREKKKEKERQKFMNHEFIVLRIRNSVKFNRHLLVRMYVHMYIRT